MPLTVFVETDKGGHTSGQLEFGIFKNVWANIGGQWAPSRSILNALVEWSGNNFNARMIASKDTNLRFSFILDNVYKLNDNWSFGNQLLLGGSNNMESSWISQLPSTYGYIATIRYDDKFNTVSASANKSQNMTLRYQRRINDVAMAGAELTINLPEKKINMTWTHKVVLDDATELNGKQTILYY